MRFGDKRNRVMLCSMLIIMMFTVFSPSVQFQISVVHAGDWETVEYIDDVEDLQTEGPIEIEGELIHQGFVPAASVTNYVDATQSQTHGTTTTGPPSGMGVDDATHSTLQEESYIATTYPTETSYTGGALPGGWTNTDWSFGSIDTRISGWEKSGGNFYTDTYDMSSYVGVRVKFDWRNDGTENTEEGELTCNSYEGGNNVWFSSPAGNKGSYEDELRDSSWHSTFWKVTFTASGLTGDLESWEGFRVDNIYLQGKVENTYYRFEAVYRFDTVEYTYGIERLYIDNDAATSTEALYWYGGITTDPTTFIGSTYADDANFDVHDVLTASPFYVKIVDLTQSGDEDQDSWLIDRLYIVVTNEPPVIDQTPVCTNLDDTNNLYARYKTYIFTTNVSDINGYADIAIVNLFSFDVYPGSGLRWEVKFDEDTNIFTEEGTDSEKNRIELDVSGSSYAKSGNTLNITWLIKIEWIHPNCADESLSVNVQDSSGAFDIESYDVDYDYETRLDYSTDPYLDDGSGTVDRGNYNSIDSVTGSGTIIYYGSGNNYPPSDEVDVWANCSDIAGSPWSDLTLVSGVFSMTVDSDDVIGNDTYFFKIVTEGAGSGGTDLYYTTSVNDTYIADSLTITITGPTDNRQNVNANASGIVVSAVYDYGGTFDGTLTLNNTDYNGDGTVVRWGYTVSSPSGDTHGVTAISTNDETYMIWDQIEVYYGAVSDGRTNVDESENPQFRLRLKYDLHLLNDYSDGVWINGSVAGWSVGILAWYKSYDQSSVGSWNFVVTSASEDTYNITAFDSTSAVTYDQDIIWDQIQVQSYTVTDDWVNINANVNIDFLVWYDHDDTPVTDGDFTLNGYDASYVGSGVWRITRTSASPALVTYNIVAVSATNAHGITLMDQNGKSRQVVWDSVTITMTDPTDQRQNIGANATGIHITITMDYNATAYGGTATMNNTDYNGDGINAVRWGYTVSSVNGGTEGITTISSNDETYMIWDRIQVQSYTVTDDWVNINNNVNIDFLVWYDYDNTQVTDGNFTLNGYDASHVGSGVWRITRTSASPALVTYNTVLVSDTNTHGIDVEDQNGKSRQVVWDSVTIAITGPTDNRQNLNANATGIHITITMDYNATAYGGTATMNNTDYNGDGTVVRWGYTVSSVNGGTEGITTISSNDETYMIWDRIYVVSMIYTGTPDTRINIGTTINFDWELHYDYDEADVSAGTHTINGYALAYQGSGIWRYSNSSSVVGDLLLDSISLGGDDTYDITEMFMNSEEVTMIWDRIYAVGLSYGGDTRVNIGTSINVDYTLHYDYDEFDVTDGTITINGYTFSHQGSGIWRNTTTNGGIVGALTFDSIVASGNTHGITTTTTNSNDVTLIWDRVIWNMYTRNATVDGGRLTNCTSVDIGETVNITARFLFEHDSTAVTSGTILLEGESMNHIANGYWYLLVSNATAQHGVFSQWNSFVTTGNTYDITVENANSKDFCIIWDSIYIDDYGVEPDGRHNLGEYSTLWVTARLTYDASPLDTTSDYIKLAGQTFQWNGSYLVNNTFTMNQVGQFTLYTNNTGHYEATYGITEIEYYSFTTIFDRVLIYAMWSPTEADNRTNYGDTETVYVSFVSEHDNSSMTAGTFELNSTGMSYVSGSIWQKTGYSYSAVVNYTFNVNSASWSAYGINQINYNGWNVTYYYIVWDRVKILTTVTDDGRIDYDTNATLSVTAELEYDSHSLGSGDTLYLNNTAMSWNGSHFVLLDQDFAMIGIWNYYVNTSGVSEATYGITYLNRDGNNVNQIWDRVYLTGIFVSDSRASYGTDVNVTVTAKAEYDNAVLGSGDSIYVNGTLATWDSTHSVFNVTYSYNEVVNKTFHVTATTEATYDITVFTNDTHVWIIWDRLKITDFAVDNVIPDPLQMIFINLTMVYEFDDAEFHFDNGTITMIAYNVTWDVEEEKNMHWNDTNWQFNHTMPAGVGVVRNFNISAYLDSVYGIVVMNWNGFDNVTAGSDRVIVVSYTVSDDRDDINDYIWVNVTLQLESNSTAIVDGDVVVNGYIFTHISGGNWRYNTTQASVTSILFDSVVAENNTYGIETVNQNGQYTTIIWDRIVITDFWVIDNRTDINTVVQIRLTAELDFDDTSLGSGDMIYINSTLATWDAGNLRFYISESYGTALNYTYALTSITETGFTITEVTNTSYIWQIWDQFVITRFNSSDGDGRANLDETEYIHFGMKWDFDNEVFQSGNGTIYLNSTLMTWNASQNCWTFSWVNSTPVSYLFAYASHMDNVHGITAIDWGAYDNVTQTWDRIGVAVVTNMTWTVVGYNVMISYTSTYESDGVTWDGNATVANTSMVATSRPRNENLTFTTITNKTFYATVISADPNGVTGFTTTTVWCVWDNVTATAMYGTEVIGSSKIFKISFGTLEWQFNGSGIGADWVCYNIRNGTLQLPATTLSSSYLEPLLQEVPVPTAWEYILYSNNATKTIGSRDYNFQWYSVIQAIVETQNIKEEITEILDTTIVISGKTNVDFTWTVYNESAPTGEAGTVSDADDWRITFNMIMTYGNHSYAIYFDAGASGDRWLNSTYFVSFDVNIDPPEVRGASVEVRGVINIACSYYVYHEDEYSDETGSLTPTTFSFFFTKEADTGLHNYSLYFNVSALIAEWKNGSYYVSADIYDCHIVILNSLYELIPFDTFEVYNNGTRIYTDDIRVTDGYDYNITVKNRYGDYVNTTAVFSAAREMVVFVNVYSLKFWSAYEGFCLLTISRGGVDYSEVLMPMEIVNFRLYSENYTYSIDYLSDIIMSGEINLLASTGVVITNDTVSDIFGLMDSLWEMTDDINITVTTVQDNTVTIQLMFDWSNTTLYNQSITIIAAFDWTNTTLYNQTISVLSAFNATNTVLYNQIVLIQNMFNWENTTLFNQTISILNAFNATNTVIYEQTINILSNISSMNSTIYSQTVSILSNIENVNSTLYSQTLNILTNITNVNSTIYAQTVSILSQITNVNTTLYAQTVSILSNITNVNSTIFSQTIDIISYVWNNANSIYNQTIDILSDIQNTNTTIYDQTVTMLSQISNVNSTIYAQTVDILNYIWNDATSIYNQTVTMLSNISNVNTTLYSQTVTLLSNIENVNSTIYIQTLSILSNISNMNTTLYSQTVTLLSNIENVNSTIYAQTLTILSDISNVNTTLYDQTVTVLTNIQNMNTTLYQQTIDILTNITNVNSTIYSQVLTVVSNLAELNATIYLVDDPTNLNLLIAGYAFSDVYCDFTIVSNWHNSTLSLYENDVLVAGPVSELLGSLRYTLNGIIGSYNLSMFIDAGMDSLWYNVSYVIEGMEYGQVNIYNSRGTGFDDTYFIVYINGSRYFDNRFYNRSDYVYNITVTDYFGYVISQDNYDWARMIDVGIDFYTYKVQSELQGQEVYFNLTRTGGARFSQHLLPGEILTYYLVAGEYTYEFRKVTALGGSTFIYYEGTFILSCDKTHIIDGTNLRDIENDIELIPTGKANTKPLEASMTGLLDTISMMQLGMWGLAFLIIAGMTVTATDEIITKEGKVIKKRKIPKQLKRFAFGRGSKNPKSKAIPKGAGRGSWKGVAFRENIKDWRENV